MTLGAGDGVLEDGEGDGILTVSIIGGDTELATAGGSMTFVGIGALVEEDLIV